MDKYFGDLFQARITVPGALYLAALIYLAAIKLSIFGGGDAEAIKTIASQIDTLKVLVAVLGASILIVVFGQVISAITTVTLFATFRSYDTFFMDSETAQKHSRLVIHAGNIQRNFDARVLINLVTQVDLTHEKELQGWVSRRWYAANVYFGCATASLLAIVTWVMVPKSSVLDWVLLPLGISFAFTFANGLLFRAEMVQALKFLFENPPPKKSNSKDAIQ